MPQAGTGALVNIYFFERLGHLADFGLDFTHARVLCLLCGGFMALYVWHTVRYGGTQCRGLRARVLGAARSAQHDRTQTTARRNVGPNIKQLNLSSYESHHSTVATVL